VKIQLAWIKDMLDANNIENDARDNAKLFKRRKELINSHIKL